MRDDDDIDDGDGGDKEARAKPNPAGARLLPSTAPC